MFRRVFVFMKKFGGKKKNWFSKIFEISVLIVMNDDVLGIFIFKEIILYLILLDVNLVEIE